MAGVRVPITIKIDAGLLREIRQFEAREGTSVSGLLAADIRRIVSARKNYRRARKRAMARLDRGLDLRWTLHASRDELHER